MKKIILLLLLLIVAISSSYAQTLAGVSTGLDVNGLLFGKTYTDAQMRAVLGEPTSYVAQNSDIENLREYRYGVPGNEDVFMHSTLSNIGFCRFIIRSPKFKLFQGQLKCGDHISKVRELKRGRLEMVGRGEYYLYINNVADDPLHIVTSSRGIITSMSGFIAI